MTATRVEREIQHGVFLASHDAEHVWGWGSPAGKVRMARRARFIAEGAGLKPGAVALEVGCGTGNFTAVFAESGARIVAVDVSPALLELAARRNLPEDQVTFLCKRFEDCDVEGPFDAVIGSSILHHLDMAEALTRIYQLLKPGGVISFAEPNMLNPQIFLQKNVPWIKQRLGDSPDETAIVRWSLAKQLRRMGFEDVSITPFDWLHPVTPSPLIGAVSALGRALEWLPLAREFAGSVYLRARRPVRS
jgi:2-polyprenyl-3-methyl-5-hydroxy-6-metoxy-1,4-benzoquinol methylase